MDIHGDGRSGGDAKRFATRSASPEAISRLLHDRARDGRKLRKKILVGGMDGYVSKPVRTGLLRAKLIAWLNHAPPIPRGPPSKRKNTCRMQILISWNSWRASKMTANSCGNSCLFSKRNFPVMYTPCVWPWILDGEKVATEAHTLKGMLSNLAASPAAGAAARLEQLGRTQEVAAFQEACTSFENISKDLLLQLDTCMVEVCR